MNYHTITKTYARKYIEHDTPKSHFELQCNLLSLLILIVKINIIEIDVTMHNVISCKNSFFHSNRSADSATSYRENIICFLNKENYVALHFKSIILCGGKDF